MKITEDDLSAQTEVRVHLDTWLKRWEWEEILENQEKAERWDTFKKVMDNGCLDIEIINKKLEQENKQLKEKLEEIEELYDDARYPEDFDFQELKRILGEKE